ncbi:YeiH family protein [Peptoniphilus raoultii]|uniref:YeiH family protein n=1 Tax=Peptoniphilus raoultii TaxID=1776387 RepID=UPI0008DA36AB|nr:YeiH family protein [Peptoniphilus raoultii]
MNFLKNNSKGLILCFIIALLSTYLGKLFPIIGGAVIAILFGMVLDQVLKNKEPFEGGIKFTAKKILQYAVILLGFGMDLGVVAKTGRQSLPIIISTIVTSLIVAFIFYKSTNISKNISTLIGVGSSICGGSAVAATAPVIDANDEEVAQAISVIFFFNVLAALIFPTLGNLIGFSNTSGEAFGIFAGTAVNDTSSVTACASTWDSVHGLGSQTLDKAVTVKLTRTLAIIPITLFLAAIRAKGQNNSSGEKVSLKSTFPTFILFFLLASLITTIGVKSGLDLGFFAPFKNLSKFFIVMAMAAIGLNTDIVKLVRKGGKPIFMGFCCWISISSVSLLIQHFLHLW